MAPLHLPSSEPSFICTFCWTPQYPPSRPKLLGRSARIACASCWKSVLDLAICWACGEMVMRGAEVVSLGWCFWHRGCFGCLVCGVGLDAPSVPGDGDGEGGERKERKGVELENIPLCLWCETATEGMGEGEVLETGLVNVSRKDGGLSRERLDMLMETGVGAAESEAVDGSMQRATTPTSGQQRQYPNRGNELEQRMRLLRGAGVGETARNGNGVSSAEHSDYIESIRPATAPPVYVSAFDVIGQPSFRPSKTKPLPKWMSLLPSNRQQNAERDGRSPSPEASLSVSRTLVSRDRPLLVADESATSSPTIPALSSRTPSPFSGGPVTRLVHPPLHRLTSSPGNNPKTYDYTFHKGSETTQAIRRDPFKRPATPLQSSKTPDPLSRMLGRAPLFSNDQIPPSQLPVRDATKKAQSLPAGDRSVLSIPPRAPTPRCIREEVSRKRLMTHEAHEAWEGSKRKRMVNGGECVDGGVGRGEDVSVAGLGAGGDRQDDLRRELIGYFHDRRLGDYSDGG